MPKLPPETPELPDDARDSGRRDALRRQRLVALFMAGLLLLNFPLLLLWDHAVDVAGLPLVPLALFGLWAGLVAVLAWLMESASD